jgi:peptide chain release factor 1
VEKKVLEKLEMFVINQQTISEQLADPAIINDQNRYKTLSKEYAQNEPLVACYTNYLTTQTDLAAAEVIFAEEKDAALQEMARDEIVALKEKLDNLEIELKTLLIPTDPNDQRNVFLEIRAGAGGDEASIFAGELFRMYSYYVANKGWRMEVINSNPGEHGGFKEIITKVIGEGAYSKLKFESGVHRVQRVPLTEAQGRIHTSTCTVAVFPEAEAIDKIEINPADLKVDTFRSSGAGGQHVNVTDSAVRLTHLPSGLVVECQDERSQHKNRAKAMALLQARLFEAEREKQRKEQAATRKSLVGTGDRSERIRTYNFPQGRLTDHRINLTLYKLDVIMEGALDDLIEPLIRAHQAELLAEG